MTLVVPANGLISWHQNPSQIGSQADFDLSSRRARIDAVLSKHSTRLARVPESSQIEIAQSSDLDSIYSLFRSACTKGSETGGFLRETYKKNELLDLIKERNVRLLRGEGGEVAAFVVVVPGTHKKFAMERLAVGFNTFGVFIKMCTWIDGPFKPLDWAKIRYISMFAQSEKHVLSPEMFKRFVRQIQLEEPSKDIYLTISGEPKPNRYMNAVAEESGFKKVGYFRSAIGRPIAYVDRISWIRPWRSDIYRLE